MQVVPSVCGTLHLTVNLAPLMFAMVSVDRHLPIVPPLLNVEPLAGTRRTVAPGQLSVEVAEKVTLLLLHWPASVLATMGAGQPIPGASASLIVTVKVQPLVLPEVSVARQLTRVMPLMSSEPL